MKNLKLTFLLLAMISLAIVSCNKDDDESTTEPGPPPEIITGGLEVSDSVFVVTGDMDLLSTGSELAAGTYRFRFEGDKPELYPGNVLVDTLNGGYIRKVTEVVDFGEVVRYETKQAALEDIFKKGTLELNLDLGVPMKSSMTADGITYKLVEDELEEASTSNYVDYEIDAELSSELSLTGSFTIEPKFNFKWVFTEENGLEQMHCYLDNTRIVLGSTFAFSAGGSVSASIQKSFGSITKRGIFWLYGVPVLMDIEVEFIAQGSVSFEEEASFPISYTNTSTLSYGIAYTNGTTSFVNAFTNNSELTATPSFEASGQVRMDIIPQVNIEFYGVLGNIIKPKPYMELAARYVNEGGLDELCAQLDAGIDLGLGVRGEVFGEEIFDFSKDFNIVKKTLWKSMDDCVLPILTISDASWALGDHSCGNNNTPYTVSMTIDDPDTLLGPGTTLQALHRFYSPEGSSTGSITRDWDEMTLEGDQLSYNICIGWVSATYVEQSFYLITADGTRSNMISVIIPRLMMNAGPSFAGRDPVLE